MSGNVIKYDDRQKYAIRKAKEKEKNSIWEGFNYLNSKLENNVSLGDFYQILEGKKNFKLKEKKNG